MRGGLRHQTQMGDLLGFGGHGREPEKPPLKPLPVADPTPRVPRHQSVPPFLERQQQQQQQQQEEQQHHNELEDTRELLKSNLVYPAPLPWAAGVNSPLKQGAAPAIAKVQPALPWLVPSDPFQEQQAAAQQAAMQARLAACERRLELQSTNSHEALERVAVEVRMARESLEARSKGSEERLGQLERHSDRLEQSSGAFREQLRALESNLRDFTVQSMNRQRSDLEGEVAEALARQQSSLEEWRSSMRQTDGQLKGEISHLSTITEELNSRLLALQSELRPRLSALETGALANRGGGSGGGSTDPQTAGLVDHLRRQVDRLSQGLAQSGAGVTELSARLEAERNARAAAEQDMVAKLSSLNQAVAAGQDGLQQSVQQRLEVLESRLGVERNDWIARQLELREEVNSGDQQAVLRMHDLAAQVRTELDAMERRLAIQDSGLKDSFEDQLARLHAARAAEDEARRASFESLLRRVEGASEKQSEMARNLRQELETSVKELGSALQQETSARLEAGQHSSAEVANFARQAVENEVSNLHDLLGQQTELIANEVTRLRRDSAERADRVSRYVDEVVGSALKGNLSNNGGSNADILVQQLSKRVDHWQHQSEQTVKAIDKKIHSTDEDLRLRQRRLEEQLESAGTSVRRDAERMAASAERRMAAAQEDLKRRMDEYVKHFDSTIASVQAAILLRQDRQPAAMSERLKPLIPASHQEGNGKSPKQEGTAWSSFATPEKEAGPTKSGGGMVSVPSLKLWEHQPQQQQHQQQQQQQQQRPQLQQLLTPSTEQQQASQRSPREYLHQSSLDLNTDRSLTTSNDTTDALARAVVSACLPTETSPSRKLQNFNTGKASVGGTSSDDTIGTPIPSSRMIGSPLIPGSSAVSESFGTPIPSSRSREAQTIGRLLLSTPSDRQAESLKTPRYESKEGTMSRVKSPGTPDNQEIGTPRDGSAWFENVDGRARGTPAESAIPEDEEVLMPGGRLGTPEKDQSGSLQGVALGTPDATGTLLGTPDATGDLQLPPISGTPDPSEDGSTGEGGRSALGTPLQQQPGDSEAAMPGPIVVLSPEEAERQLELSQRQ